MNENQALRGQLKAMVRGTYDLQKLRIQMGNRIVGNFKVKLGQEPGKREESLDSEGKEILLSLRQSYDKITDGVTKFPKHSAFQGDGVITSYTELCLVDEYVKLERAEEEHFGRLKGVLSEFPIWDAWLSGVMGVGPAMGGVLVSEIDIAKARYVSSLWKYAGLDVGPDGRGRSRRQEHLVDAEYVDKDGNPATRKSITFNPFLKTKLLGVLGGSFLKCGPEKSPYAAIYYERKHRLESHAIYGIQNDGIKDGDGHWITSKARRHAMAIRESVKRFLADLYGPWRESEGLPVHLPYDEAKLGRKHGTG